MVKDAKVPAIEEGKRNRHLQESTSDSLNGKGRGNVSIPKKNKNHQKNKHGSPMGERPPSRRTSSFGKKKGRSWEQKN